MINVRIEGVDSILSNLKRAVSSEKERMDSKLSKAGNTAYKGIRAQASLTDHSLEDLAMGSSTWRPHPYSRKYPTNYGPHGDDTLVHKQSGLLYENIQKNESIGNTESKVEVGVSESDVPYIGDLVNGNPRMRPRNFISKGFELSLPEIKKEMSGE